MSYPQESSATHASPRHATNGRRILRHPLATTVLFRRLRRLHRIGAGIPRVIVRRRRIRVALDVVERGVDRGQARGCARKVRSVLGGQPDGDRPGTGLLSERGRKLWRIGRQRSTVVRDGLRGRTAEFNRRISR